MLSSVGTDTIVITNALVSRYVHPTSEIVAAIRAYVALIVKENLFTKKKAQIQHVFCVVSRPIQVFENKLLRTIFGPVWEMEQCTNYEFVWMA